MSSTEFSFDTVKDFSTHINQSIPTYGFLLKQVSQLATYFIQKDTNVVDLGCSTGNVFKALPLVEGVRYIGIDNSENLLPESKPPYEYRLEDLNRFGMDQISLATSLFTLQFVPEARHNIYEILKLNLVEGGAFINCEKIYSESAKMQDITNSLYYEFKRGSFSTEEILQKEQDLREMARLKTLDEIMEDMRSIGTPEIFWKSYNFVGIIVLK